MSAISATDAKNRFGQVLESARTEPVHVQKNGRDVAVRLPGLVEQLNGLLSTINAELQGSKDQFRDIVANVAAIAEVIRQQAPAVGKIVANAEVTTADVRRMAATAERILQTNSDAVGALIDEWTVTAESARRLADQINSAVAENRLDILIGERAAAK